jgi:hypothetical protein
MCLGNVSRPLRPSSGQNMQQRLSRRMLRQCHATPKAVSCLPLVLPTAPRSFPTAPRVARYAPRLLPLLATHLWKYSRCACPGRAAGFPICCEGYARAASAWHFLATSAVKPDALSTGGATATKAASAIPYLRFPNIILPPALTARHTNSDQQPNVPADTRIRPRAPRVRWRTWGQQARLKLYCSTC